MVNDNNLLWALYYESDAYSVSGSRIMGRQAAGNSLLKAYAKSDIPKIGVYTNSNESLNNFSNDLQSLMPANTSKDLVRIPWGSPQNSSNFGGIYFPAPDIDKLANQRYFFGHNKYSIVGVTHTTASEGVIKSLLNCYTSPLNEWDAIIATSNSVKNSINTLYDQYFTILKDKFGATKRPNFQIPIIPLGVHNEDYNFSDDAKSLSRDKLGIDRNDIVLLFLGRISFHAKAHHVPMYIALEEVAKKLGKKQKIHMIQTGWFPNDYVEKIYIDDAKKISPSVQFHFLDGKNIINKSLSYSAADIFISLVDNFQETFGLTPLEAMASGIPVIVSDWNGYKDTVRDGIDGFRIRTTTMEPGNGYNFALNHNMGFDNYDHYIGRTSQTVAIDINEVIDKILLLINDKTLRLKLGENGKKRALEFDWIKILGQYKDLKANLDNNRKNSGADKSHKYLPPPIIQDQYTYFSDYSTDKINYKTFISLNIKIDSLKINELSSLGSINFIKNVVPSIVLLENIISYINENNGSYIGDLIKNLNINEYDCYKSVLWLAKYGYVEVNNSND
jgi:glycosyltransferase involved in cell wall biosynthesis